MNMHLLQVITILLALSRLGLMTWSSNSAVNYYCGSSLTDALSSVCKKIGFATHFSPRDSNRTTRGIIEECCNNPCSKDDLSQYCKKKIARIPISKKRNGRHLTLIETNKISKRKRSPTSIRGCGNPSDQKSLRRNRKRSSNLQKRKRRLTSYRSSSAISSTTTEKQFAPEAQYIDDWTGNEESPPFILSTS